MGVTTTSVPLLRSIGPTIYLPEFPMKLYLMLGLGASILGALGILVCLSEMQVYGHPCGRCCCKPTNNPAVPEEQEMIPNNPVVPEEQEMIPNNPAVPEQMEIVEEENPDSEPVQP